jgi:hypothetical protein
MTTQPTTPNPKASEWDNIVALATYILTYLLTYLHTYLLGKAIMLLYKPHQYFAELNAARESKAMSVAVSAKA